MCECPRCFYDLGNDIGGGSGECPVCRPPYTIESEGGETWSGDEYPVAVWPEVQIIVPTLEDLKQLAEMYNTYIEKLPEEHRSRLPGGNY
jgi:hypothetical protein